MEIYNHSLLLRGGGSSSRSYDDPSAHINSHGCLRRSSRNNGYGDPLAHINSHGSLRRGSRSSYGDPLAHVNRHGSLRAGSSSSYGDLIAHINCHGSLRAGSSSSYEDLLVHIKSYGPLRGGSSYGDLQPRFSERRKLEKLTLPSSCRLQSLAIICQSNCHANCHSLTLSQLTSSEPSPQLASAHAFAPATIANLGPGFDFLGCAVDGLGDRVIAHISPHVPPGKVSIASISGDQYRLSYEPEKNCAGIAARATMQLLGVRSVGISLSLQKGLPLGSGLGSSAASAAAAAVAVNALFGNLLSKDELVFAGLESEAAVSGYHADNVAPSLMGGFILVQSYNPLHLIPLAFPSHSNLYFVLVSPAFEAPTKEMRAVLPKEIAMRDHVFNSSQAAALVAAILQGDLALLGKSLSSDSIVEPRRRPLIPGMDAVKEAALRAGAFGCTISGAGPTAVAITDSEEKGKMIGSKMIQGFLQSGNLNATACVQKLDRQGARVE